MNLALDLAQREIFVSACSSERLNEISVKFEKRSTSKITFWEYMKYLEDPRLGFSDIANILGVSRQAVYHIYNTWFRDIFPDRSSKRVKVKYLPESLQGLRQEIEKAKMFEFLPKELKIKPHNINKNLAKHLFFIETGNKIFKGRLSKITNCRQYGSKEARYSKFNVTAKNIESLDFVIIRHKTEGVKECYYILPKKVVLQYQGKTGNIVIYLPTSKKYRPIASSVVNILLYRNAWNLLQGDKE